MPKILNLFDHKAYNHICSGNRHGTLFEAKCVDESAERGLERSAMFNVKFDVSCGMENVQKNL